MLTGLRLTPYYLAPKLRLLLQQDPALTENLLARTWLLGTLDTYLIWRLTDGRHYHMDVSMAARTLLLDIHTQQWSSRLCELFGIPLSILPQITASTSLDIPLNNGPVLRAMLADQSAALFAAVGSRSDVALVNLGTGGFVIRNHENGQSGAEGYLHTLVIRGKAAPPQFADEGTLNSIASALAPYPVARCLPGQLGQQADIFCLAEPSGLGAPYFRKDLGLTFSAPVDDLTEEQLAALLLEAVIFRVARIVEAFQCDAPLSMVYLSGGLAELKCIQQGLAECLKIPLVMLQQHEASLQGAAMLAAACSNTAIAAQQDAISPAQNPHLAGKFLRWKCWLDGIVA